MTAEAGTIHVLVDALAARFGGTAYALIQLVPRLADDPAVQRVTVVTRRGSIVAGGLPDHPGVDVVELRRARRSALGRRAIWQAYRLPRLVERVGADCVLTYAGMFPRQLPVPTVSHLLNPVPFQRGGLANERRRLAIARTSSWAARVLVPSEAMLDLTEPAIGRPAELVRLGVDHRRFHPPDAPGDDVLYVADFYRHKRHDLALAAWERLPAPRPRLRFIGNPAVDLPWYRELATRIEVEHPAGVTLESGLALEDLVAAYRGARVFLLPSQDESFSMPLLESVACGVPAVARDLPVLRETGGPGCTFVAGDDPERWAAALSVLIDDDAVHGAAREASIAHAAGFSWERMAADTCAHLVAAVRDPAPPAPRPPAQRARTLLARTAAAALAGGALLVALVAAVAARDTPVTPAPVPEPPARPVPEPPTRPGPAGGRAPDAVVYGGGFGRRVDSPLDTVADLLGRWRQLGPRPGRLAVAPGGPARRFFYLAAFVRAPAAGAVRVTTQAGDGETLPVPAREPTLLTFGPFERSTRPPILLRIDHDLERPVTVSPVMVGYLRAGESLVRPAPLAQDGPDGVSGLLLPGGATAGFRTAPPRGRGPFTAVLVAAAAGRPVQVTVDAGGRSRSGRVSSARTRLELGPFARAANPIGLTVDGPASDGVVVERLRLRPR